MEFFVILAAVWVGTYSEDPVDANRCEQSFEKQELNITPKLTIV